MGEDGVGSVVVAEAGVHDGVGGGGTSSDRVRLAIGVGPACGMGYGRGLGPIDGKGAGGTSAVPGDTVGETEGLGLGIGLELGEGGVRDVLIEDVIVHEGGVFGRGRRGILERE